MFHGFNTLPAHIQDTLYILTVEMECQDGAHGKAGVMLFCDIVGTLLIMISIIGIGIWVMLLDTSHKK
jgi:hypothetical protein